MVICITTKGRECIKFTSEIVELVIMKKQNKPLGEVVDLFCGVGALSHGLKRAGFDIKAGYDTDKNCKFAFEKNNNSIFYSRDVSTLTAKEVSSHFSGDVPSILAGCAPCQPFSSYKQRYDEDPQWNLVSNFANLAVEVMPDFVTMENVPALVKYKEGKVFESFIQILENANYTVNWSIAKCEEFGVPQRRRRLVVVASKAGLELVLEPNAKKTLVTVKKAIGTLPTISAGEAHPSDSLHTAASLSETNLKRIKASKQGGTWRDWPEDLVAACHKKASGQTYPGVYARMSWDQPSPTMTTQCFGFGNGRFGHPEQNRAISLREAAILQSFPQNYKFLPKGQKPSVKEVGRWIGNAVPVKLAEAIGKLIINSHYGDIKVVRGKQPKSI